MTTQLTEDQKNFLNNTFGVDLDALGETNYSVYHQTNYQVGPIELYIDGDGQIFSTEAGGKLTCLVIHNGNPVVKSDDCLLQEGFNPTEHSV